MCCFSLRLVGDRGSGPPIFFLFDPCKFSCIADFQNVLISRIFSVFTSGFLHRTTLNDL